MTATKIICDWHTECSCGYGRGSYTSPPTVILTPESIECSGCGETFTAVLYPYLSARADQQEVGK